MKRLLKYFSISRMRRFAAHVGTFGKRQFPSQELSFECLKRLGWKPTKAIDVGAYHGEWTKTFKSIFPECKVLMIEAQSGKEEVLQLLCENSGGTVSLEMALLGASDGQEVTFVEMETGSSVFEEKSPYDRKPTIKKTRRLDTVLNAHPQFLSPQMLKLDTQGYELEILRGCPEVLRSAEVVLQEASLIPVNTGAPDFADVITFMSEAGFKLFDFCSQIRRKDGVLWQTDLMFVRRDSSIEIESELTRENWG